MPLRRHRLPNIYGRDLSSELSDPLADEDQPEAPPTEEVLREFHDYVEVMSPMSEPEEAAMQRTSIEDKWSLIRNQKRRSPVFPLSYYIEGLKRQVGTSRGKRFSWSKGTRSKDGVSHLTHILRKLKTDLKFSPDTFLCEFIRQPCDGVRLLVQLLQDMQLEMSPGRSSRRIKTEEMKRALSDEYDCLLCLQFAIIIQEGLFRLLQLSDGPLDSIALCLTGEFIKCRTSALQIMIGASEVPEGYLHVMRTMSKTRLHNGENVRFHSLMQVLNAGRQTPTHVIFMATCVQLLNRLVACVEDANARVYLQYELTLAGFEPTNLDRYAYADYSYECRTLQRELETWRDNVIDVNSHNGALAALSGRNHLLRNEIDRLQQDQKLHERGYHQLEEKLTKVKAKSEEYRERAAELQDTVDKLNRLYEQQTGQPPCAVARELNIHDALASLDVPPDSQFGTIRSVRSISEISVASEAGTIDSVNIPVPPAPPMPFSQTVRKKVVCHANMPILNWTPIADVKHTIFENCDDEELIREIDFSAFENAFKLVNIIKPGKELRGKTNSLPNGDTATNICFVDLNRARNIAITQRKTGLSAEQLRLAIDQCQTNLLSGESAELFLKFIPTKHELRSVSQYKHDYDRLGEAEQLIYKLAQVARLETKLQIITFMGSCHELIASVKPKMECILNASKSVLWCHEKLTKIFSIILAFGNYMNSSRKGYALGFRLQSLYKVLGVKSRERKQSLMHYVVQFIEDHYPELLAVAEDLHVHVDKGVSYQAIVTDMVSLRQGVDLVKFEREKQPENDKIEMFHSEVSMSVALVAELFKVMEDSYRDVCALFGENHRDIEPDELFKTLEDFTANIQIAHGENLQRGIFRGHGTTPSLDGDSNISSDVVDSSIRRSPTPIKPFFSHQYRDSFRHNKQTLSLPTPRNISREAVDASSSVIASNTQVDVRILDEASAETVHSLMFSTTEFNSSLLGALSIRQTRLSESQSEQSNELIPDTREVPPPVVPIQNGYIHELKEETTQFSSDDLDFGDLKQEDSAESIDSGLPSPMTSIRSKKRIDLGLDLPAQRSRTFSGRSNCSYTSTSTEVCNALATLDKVVFEAEMLGDSLNVAQEDESSYL